MKRYTQKGFTLIELMTTIVIIGIISSMAVPRFKKAYNRMEFQSANREIASAIKVARSMAISNKAVFGVNFNSANKSVSLFKKDTASVLLNTFEVSDSLVHVDSLLNIFSAIATDITDNTISFRPNGSAIYSGGGNIFCMTFTDDLVGINQINVLASTGRVKSVSNYYY